MVRIFKWIGMILGTLIGLLIIAVIVLSFIANQNLNHLYAIESSTITIPSDTESIARGQHIVHAVAACTSCHGSQLEGEVFIDGMPMGLVVASNLTGFSFQNWWALFILIPAIYQLSIVWRGYQENGRLTSASTGPLIGGLGALAVAAVFLIDGISWGVIWPIAFVFGGISLLLSQR